MYNKRPYIEAKCCGYSCTSQRIMTDRKKKSHRRVRRLAKERLAAGRD